MEQVILVRYAEIHLKGLNRPYFERKLVEGISGALSGMDARVEREQGRMFVWGVDAAQLDEALDRLTRVFGIHSISPAVAVEKDWDTMVEAAYALCARALAQPGMERATFKVFCRRGDKRFPMSSDAINRELGHLLLERFPGLSVDVHKPQLEVRVEVRDKAFLYMQEIMCAGGMPAGTAGKGTLLISGGIDSPVAGYLLAKRGLELSAVHFYSYPYTSERARDKVVELTALLARYAGPIKLHLVPFTEIQLAIYDGCPSKETTILMRRQMMKLAERLALQDGAKALVTGEALGQVASQTLEGLCVTDDAVQMPVFRPLIGFDKEDIVAIAKRIGTFETSIQPYEDCCTVFVPQHPVTKPEVMQLRQSESLVDFEPMLQRAIEQTETQIVS